jgi:hypothetical protein
MICDLFPGVVGDDMIRREIESRLVNLVVRINIKMN